MVSNRSLASWNHTCWAKNGTLLDERIRTLPNSKPQKTPKLSHTVYIYVYKLWMELKPQYPHSTPGKEEKWRKHSWSADLTYNYSSSGRKPIHLGNVSIPKQSRSSCFWKKNCIHIHLVCHPLAHWDPLSQNHELPFTEVLVFFKKCLSEIRNPKNKIPNHPVMNSLPSIMWLGISCFSEN
jgi:hypothetical protein